MQTGDKVRLTTTDRDEADRLAEWPPRPNTVRCQRDGAWAVAQIVPTPWRRQRSVAPTLAQLAVRQQARRPATSMRVKASA